MSQNPLIDVLEANRLLELFDVQEQVQAYIQVLSELVKRAEEWTAILRSRIMNDAIAKAEFEERVRLLKEQDKDISQQLCTLVSTKML